MSEFLVVKHNDGAVKRKMKDGQFERNAIGQPARRGPPGLPEGVPGRVCEADGRTQAR
ncbi:MAG: hypothetical protein ACLULH_13415 [Bacteroides fragilis]